MLGALLAALLVAAPCSARGDGIELVGVVGNSGVAGADLLRVTTDSSPSGIHVDRDMCLWFSVGDALVHTTLDGRLLERFPLAPACRAITGPTLAALNGTLYFFGAQPKAPAARPGSRQPASHAALFGLPMKPGATVALVRAFPEIADHMVGRIAAQPLDGALLVGLPVPSEGKVEEAGLFRLDPRNGELREAFPLRARRISGIAVDPARREIYLGGYFGKVVTSKSHHPNVCEILRLDATGRELARADVFGMEAIPSEFRGMISLADDSVWDVAWYGFLGRLDRQLRYAPGKITGWNQEMPFPCQIVGFGESAGAGASQVRPLVMSMMEHQHVYLARWNPEEQRIELALRIGALGAVHSLNLSAEGWLSVATPGIQLWWRWSDGPANPPRFGNVGAALTSGIFNGETLTALAMPRGYDEGRTQVKITAARFSPTTARDSCTPDYGRSLPFFAPAGYAATEAGAAYASDRRTRTIWRTRTGGLARIPVADLWKPMSLSPELQSPGEVVALANGDLAVADGAAVVILRPDGAQLSHVERFEACGPRPEDRFGPGLHLAGDGVNLVIADTSRHRIAWLDVQGRRQGQFGETDTPGDDLAHVSAPTCAAVVHDRLVVYDSGNQRLLKLMLRKTGGLK